MRRSARWARLTGMACHRDAKEQYLAVRSKADYWSVPVAELVMETRRRLQVNVREELALEALVFRLEALLRDA